MRLKLVTISSVVLIGTVLALPAKLRQRRDSLVENLKRNRRNFNSFGYQQFGGWNQGNPYSYTQVIPTPAVMPGRWPNAFGQMRWPNARQIPAFNGGGNPGTGNINGDSSPLPPLGYKKCWNSIENKYVWAKGKPGMVYAGGCPPGEIEKCFDESLGKYVWIPLRQDNLVYAGSCPGALGPDGATPGTGNNNGESSQLSPPLGYKNCWNSIENKYVWAKGKPGMMYAGGCPPGEIEKCFDESLGKYVWIPIRQDNQIYVGCPGALRPDGATLEGSNPGAGHNNGGNNVAEGGLLIENLVDNPCERRSGNGDRLAMHYEGKLADTGKQFDASAEGKPFIFELGAGSVIRGWDQGLKDMCPGDERKLTIPSSLGYGDQGGGGGKIPGGATLLFKVKLIAIKNGDQIWK